MGEVVPARTSPTLLPHPFALCYHYPVSKCCSASIVVTSTVRVKEPVKPNSSPLHKSEEWHEHLEVRKQIDKVPHRRLMAKLDN